MSLNIYILLVLIIKIFIEVNGIPCGRRSWADTLSPDVCQCHPEIGVVDCTGKHLLKVPVFRPSEVHQMQTISLRKNSIRFVPTNAFPRRTWEFLHTVDVRGNRWFRCKTLQKYEYNVKIISDCPPVEFIPTTTKPMPTSTTTMLQPTPTSPMMASSTKMKPTKMTPFSTKHTTKVMSRLDLENKFLDEFREYVENETGSLLDLSNIVLHWPMGADEIVEEDIIDKDIPFVLRGTFRLKHPE